MSLRITPIARCQAIAFVFAWAAASHAETRVTTVAIPHGGQPAAAKTDAEGTIHLLFHSPHGPQYVRSLDNGKSFSKPISIVGRQEAAQPGHGLPRPAHRSV